MGGTVHGNVEFRDEKMNKRVDVSVRPLGKHTRTSGGVKKPQYIGIKKRNRGNQKKRQKKRLFTK